VGTDSARERRRSSKILTLLLRLRWTRQVCLATLIPEREMASSRAFTPSAGLPVIVVQQLWDFNVT